MPKKLKIDLEELIFAMQSRDSWYDHYLDLKTGRIIIDDDEEFPGEDGEAFDKNDQERYLFIDPFESNDGFRLMEEFIEGLENREAKGKLLKSISGAKPFRNFKDALSEFPETREDWFKFEEGKMNQYAVEWLKEKEIEISLQ
jgi:hypothetical protein